MYILDFEADMLREESRLSAAPDCNTRLLLIKAKSAAISSIAKMQYQVNPQNLGFGITIAVVVVVMSANIGANPLDFISGVQNLLIVAEEMANVDSSLLDTAFWAMLETLQMAFIGTVVGVVIGLPLSLLSSRNISSKWIYVPIRSLLAAIRTFPSILWAILFVIMVGTGAFAGILAIVMYTVGLYQSSSTRLWRQLTLTQ